MFERFTDRARQVVVLAQEEARRLKHDHIGTEHLLLGIMADADTIAARVLTSSGISVDAVRGQVEERVAEGKRAPSGHIPFTMSAKKVLELSLREALRLSHNYIGTEHILLGLAREGEGVAAEVLAGLGLDVAIMRDRVMDLLAGSSGELPIEDASEDVSEQLFHTARMSATVGAEPLRGDEPRCPRCNAATAGNMRARSATVPLDKPDDRPYPVTLLWCGVCGALLGVVPGADA